MFLKKQFRSVAVFTLFIFTFFALSLDYSFGQEKIKLTKSQGDSRSGNSIKTEKEEANTSRVLEAGETEQSLPSMQEKENPEPQLKKKKRFPWLLAILGTGAAVALLMVLIKKKNSTSGPTATYADGVLIVNGLRYEMASIPAGTFQMGSDSPEAYSSEQPVHTVRISKEFRMGKTEVTQALWQAVMGTNPSLFIGGNFPVDRVSWNDCQAFVQKLNQMLGGNNLRLPTEAEWEYACRAGTTGDR